MRTSRSKSNKSKQSQNGGRTKKIIIHIDGVQGSGKSYICSKLNILCVDTDDIMKRAIQIIEDSQQTNKKMPRTFNQIQKIERQLVNKYLENNDKIAFVGMTADIPLCTYKFFIKITDFTSVYKRLLSRELEKIYINYKKIKKHINEENNPREIDIQRIADMSLVFPVDYKDFLKDYKERLSKAKKKIYLPRTQEQIISIVNNL